MSARSGASWRDDEVVALGEVATKFVESELLANREQFERQHQVDRDVWRRAGRLGLLCCSVPEEYGGGGGTFAHDLAVIEAQARTGETGWGNGVHSGIVAHYILAYGTEEQKHRWLPGMASGELVGAIAMTEPGTGSDLKNIRTRAVRQGDEYVINGAKTFITNGQQADLIVVAVKTDPGAGAKGVSLIVVEPDACPGFVRGRVLEKVGQPAADTSELSFEDARVPVGNLLGPQPNGGFGQLMTQLAQERLIISVIALATAESAVALTTAYAKSREMFDKSLWDFQNTRFVLAEAATTARIGRVFVDDCVRRHLAGDLDVTTAAMSKWWTTEQFVTIVDRCMQLFGGYGYMREYPIARMYADARITKVFAGSNETMKDLVARSL
ncbi:acyl-CoA dehydrogenase family protein [Streptomyces sp. NPDC057684]|uniref:acyl-CoA dehydrogenase family protein n=1 Tax=unclassified Streptomyces TaxID=2593676 RepID=UPI0036B042E4